MSQKYTHLDILKLMLGSSDYRMSAPFGEKGFPRSRPHDGTDYATPEGITIKFPFDAEVTFEHYGVKGPHIESQGEKNDFGNHTGFYVPEFEHTILVAHTMYKSSQVSVGKSYKRGDVITKTGNTGMSTGAHLHVGIAPGKITSLSALRNKAVNFEAIVFWPGWKDEPSKPVTTNVKVGDMVLVASGAKDYNGTSVSSIFNTTRHRVDELKGDRAVLDIGGLTTAFKVDVLIKSEAPKPTPKSKLIIIGKDLQGRQEVELLRRDGSSYGPGAGITTAVGEVKEYDIVEEVSDGFFKIFVPRADTRETYVRWRPGITWR